MKLDNEDQRKWLVGLIEAAGFPGSAIDQVYGLKKAILEAEIDGHSTPALIAQEPSMRFAHPAITTPPGHSSEDD